MFDTWRGILEGRGLLREGDDPVEEYVLAMHRYLAQTPSRVLCAALTERRGRPSDAEPARHHERVPELARPAVSPDGKQMFLEDVFTSARARRLATVMNRFTTQVPERR